MTNSEKRLQTRSSSESDQESKKRSSGGIVEIVAAVPVLVLRLGVTFLRVKVKRRRGVRVFRRQLKHSGFSREQVKGLVADYERMGRLRDYLPGELRGFRFMRS